MAGPIPSTVIASMSFVGRSGGAVKTLNGFKKGHHSVPDAVNATTHAFLGRLCATELAEEAERLFQEARTALGYKRKDISLTLASPLATLVAKDFSVEIGYTLEDADPARFVVTTTMRELRDFEVARSDGFARVFARGFAEIAFELKRGAQVEAVIDAIEALDGEGGLSVRYPSDYSDCTISVEDIDANVRCTGATLEMVFPRNGAPAELLDAFLAVREAFQISKALAGLIG
jgi:hypothetical protein